MFANGHREFELKSDLLVTVFGDNYVRTKQTSWSKYLKNLWPEVETLLIVDIHLLRETMLCALVHPVWPESSMWCDSEAPLCDESLVHSWRTGGGDLILATLFSHLSLFHCRAVHFSSTLCYIAQKSTSVDQSFVSTFFINLISFIITYIIPLLHNVRYK